jgi:O-antigen ligase
MQRTESHIGKLLASSLKYLTAAILIYIPLYPKFPFITLPGSAVAIRAEDFLILLTSFVFLGYLFSSKKKTLPPLAFQIIIYLFVGFVSCLSAILITKNVSPLITLLHLFRRVEYMLVFFFVYYVGISGWLTRRFLFELVLLPVIGVFGYGIAQIYFQAPVISTMNTEFAKGVALTLQPGVMLSSTFAGHYDLAIYLIMILAYITSLLTFTKKKIHLSGLFLSFISLLWILTQTSSRIAIFGLIFSISLICFLRKRLVLGIILIFLVGASILTSPSLISRLGNLLRVFQAKIQTSLIIRPVFATEILRPIQQDRSTSIRFDVEWPRAMRSFYKNPFLGTGYSSITLATDNEYLRSLGETGLLGFLAFASILTALGKGIYARYQKAKSKLDKTITLGSLGVFSIFLISAIFLDVFEASKIAILFWAFTGLAMSTKS